MALLFKASLKHPLQHLPEPPSNAYTSLFSAAELEKAAAAPTRLFADDEPVLPYCRGVGSRTQEWLIERSNRLHQEGFQFSPESSRDLQLLERYLQSPQFKPREYSNGEKLRCITHRAISRLCTDRTTSRLLASCLIKQLEGKETYCSAIKELLPEEYSSLQDWLLRYPRLHFVEPIPDHATPRRMYEVEDPPISIPRGIGIVNFIVRQYQRYEGGAKHQPWQVGGIAAASTVRMKGEQHERKTPHVRANGELYDFPSEVSISQFSPTSSIFLKDGPASSFIQTNRPHDFLCALEVVLREAMAMVMDHLARAPDPKDTGIADYLAGFGPTNNPREVRARKGAYYRQRADCIGRAIYHVRHSLQLCHEQKDIDSGSLMGSDVELPPVRLVPIAVDVLEDRGLASKEELLTGVRRLVYAIEAEMIQPIVQQIFEDTLLRRTKVVVTRRTYFVA